MSDKPFDPFFQVEDERLARLVKEVWKSLPRGAKCRIRRRLEYTTDNGNGAAMHEGRPGVVLFARTYWRPLPVPMKYNKAQIGLVPGNLLPEPDDLIRGMIAHEWAHVYLGHFWNYKPSDGDRLDMELDADELAEEWGYEANGFLGALSIIPKEE